MTRRPRIGTVVTVPDPMLAELIGAAFEFAWIDLEHGALTVADVPRLALALRAAECEAEVRLPSWRSEALAPALDAGVDGVVAPCVERAEDATAFVRRLRYPPHGDRGYGPRRAGAYGRTSARQVRCSVQIESASGVRHAHEIARVDGIDALVVGCADLALALGHAARPDAAAGPRAPRPEAAAEASAARPDAAAEPRAARPDAHDEPSAALTDAIAEVGAAARGAGVEFGIAGASPRLLRGGLPAHVDAIVHSVDVRLYAAAADAAAALAREVAA